MAKKTPKKKNNRKVFRTIRKSTAALFLATSLIVAAIPVPDTQAVDEIVFSENGYSAQNEVISDKRQDILDNDARGECVYDITEADDDKELDPNNMLSKLPDEKEYESYTICMLDNGRWELNWQFKFYLRENTSGITRGIISKYNDEYQEETVSLTNQVVSKYYEVFPQDFNDFYNYSDPSLPQTEGNSTYTFTYETDFIHYKTNNVETDVMKWFAKYRNEMYTSFLEACEKYYEAYLKYEEEYAQYLVDLEAYENLPEEEKAHTKKPTPPKDITIPKPTQIEITPGKDFSEGEKLAYYCDFDDDLKQYGSGYVLVSVIDSRGDVGATAEYTYIAANGTPIGTATNDQNGFLIVEESAGIMGIGNEAFKDVTNVETLELPSQIGYIGDEAFMGSFLKSIVIQNVTYIGNRAFKNCSLLADVTIRGTKIIGTECFYNSGIETVYLPYSVMRVDPGAFANCKKLTDVNLSDVASGCEVGRFAFYNCYSLNTVSMADADISSLGTGCFAVSSGATGTWVDAVLPTHMHSTVAGSTESTIGNYLFAGRSNLNSVTFPTDYGRTSEIEIPSGVFLNCASLSFVHFPDEGGGSCGYIKFAPNLFLDVVNTGFYVKGPEKGLNGKTALPRSSTWAAITGNLDNIPYVYVNSEGIECYEVSDGSYLLQANSNGELTSCDLVGVLTDYIDLIIPSRVGNYKINSIAEGCFEDEELRKWIRTIIIEDDSVAEIGAEVFANLPALKSVQIGNSVNTIGDGAFKGCELLTDVSFATPSAGYENFSIGTDAFKTGSKKLHFYADIVENYAPFVWAMQPDNVIDDFGTRVCYTSLSPTYLTVMYDNTSQKVTLLDYPKYDQLDVDHASHNRGMENYYYDMYADDSYDEYRELFKNDWLTDETTAYDSQYYGPWVNEMFCSTYGTWSVDGTNGKPDAYFTTKPYSIRANYEKGSSAVGVYETTTSEEEAWISSTTNIVVPAGVDSIDVFGFIEGSTANFRNVTTYLNNCAGYDMYTKAMEEDVTPGLFSGYYKDYVDETAYEVAVKGNDRVEAITLNSVTSLPDYAFDDCERLKVVILGPDCADIGTAPFRGCDNLTTVGSNEHYKYNNGIIYSVNEDGTLTIEECLPSRGNPESGVGQTMIDATNDPDISNVSAIREGAFEDCDFISTVDLSAASNLQVIPENAFKGCESLAYVMLPETVNRIESGSFAENKRLDVTIPGIEVFIASDAFEHVPTINVRTYEDSAALEYAKYYNLSYTIINEKYRVLFLDYDGTELCEPQYIESGKNAVEPEHPTREGYEFTGWSGEFINITKDTTLVAQYKSLEPENGGDGDGNTDGDGNGDNNGDDGSGSGSGTGGNGSGNGTGNGGSDGDGSGTGSGNVSAMFSVTVENGSGSGSYTPGSTVIIVANDPPSGYTFSKWTTDDGISLASVRISATTFTMPSKNVTVTANYTKASSNGSGAGSSTTVSGNASSNNSNKNNGTTVTINKNGISNSDLASATVNGSTDKFVIKITDSISATDAVEKALKNEYGSLDNIKYYAMDISLYDSTGTTKIKDTTGLTVDITIPIPDGLVAYGGNNKVAGVVNEKLDKLAPKFTTIDGVPCVTFRATHFSPYTVYVDTANLTTGVLDSTPKTGDGIHPKWFLAIGLACISVVLFSIKDKKEPKAKLA